MTAEFFSHSEAQTRELGRKFAALLEPGICVLLCGDLGAGKTVFVRGVGEALGIDGVRSPSFTLINEYEATSGLNVIHADLYRLEDASSLGLEEYVDYVLFVEWPDRWRNPPEEDVIELRFKSLSQTARAIAISAQGAKAERVIAGL